MKACTGCGRLLPLTAFGPERRVRDGRKARCRECERAETNRRRGPGWIISDRQRARMARLQEMKARGCARCGESDDACLDFHHRDPAARTEKASRLVTRANFEREFAGLVVLCANCHRKLHAGRWHL